MTMIATTPNPITVLEPERLWVPGVSLGLAREAEPLEEDGEFVVVDLLADVDFVVESVGLIFSDFD
jgi:hypothetical protein